MSLSIIHIHVCTYYVLSYIQSMIVAICIAFCALMDKYIPLQETTFCVLRSKGITHYCNQPGFSQGGSSVFSKNQPHPRFSFAELLSRIPSDIKVELPTMTEL